MRLAGRPYSEIAKKLGRTINAVKIAWSRYGPSPEYQRIQAYLKLLRRTVNVSLRMINNKPELLERFMLAGRGVDRHVDAHTISV